jgi:hypothetical protein
MKLRRFLNISLKMSNDRIGRESPEFFEIEQRARHDNFRGALSKMS